MCRAVSDGALLQVTSGRDSRLIIPIPGSAQCCPSPYLVSPPLVLLSCQVLRAKGRFPQNHSVCCITEASPRAAKKWENPFLCHCDRSSVLRAAGLAVTSGLKWSDTLHVLYPVTCYAEHSLPPDLVFRSYTLLAKHREYGLSNAVTGQALPGVIQSLSLPSDLHWLASQFKVKGSGALGMATVNSDFSTSTPQEGVMAENQRELPSHAK